jgi:hypothetical protein
MEKMKNPAPEWSVEDIQEELRGSYPELLRRFQELPSPLWPRHFAAMEALAKKNPEEDADQLRMEYLLGVIAAREHAIVEFESKDSFFHNEAFMSGEQAGAFHARLQELFASREHILGSGMTARVKSMQVEGFDAPIAVKYLVTPTAKTLSAQGEHDMLYEVEVVTKVEKRDAQLGVGNYIRVPTRISTISAVLSSATACRKSTASGSIRSWRTTVRIIRFVMRSLPRFANDTAQRMNRQGSSAR